MSDNVVNFNKARKAKARSDKEKRAAENRVKFGRRKSDKKKAAVLVEKQKKLLDGHKRDKPDGDD